MTVVVAAHDECPPSLNVVASRGSRWKYSAEKKKWEGICAVLFLQAGVPRGCRSVRLDAILRFPDKRRRDTGNFRFMLEKAAGDALVRGGWLTDDTPDFYEFTTLRFDPERGPRQTTLYITYEREGGDT